MSHTLIASPGWLLKQDNMQLINQCRKYIQMEFDARLLFSQNDLLDRIRDYSERSQNRKLKQLTQDLLHRLQQPAESSPVARPVRMYRGQSITGLEPDVLADKPRSPVIYRGHSVSA